VNVPRYRPRASAWGRPGWPQNKRAHRFLSVAGVLLVLAGFVFSGAMGALAYFYPVLTAAATQTGQKVDPLIVSSSTPAPIVPSTTAPFTVLLLGSDDDQKCPGCTPLTQSMILVRVDPAAHAVTMLSIPRDLWVPLSTGGYGKMDWAYGAGGAKAAIATVERNFHVHVDDYIWVGLLGLIRLIDAAGGVDLVTTRPVLDDYYPNDIYSNNPFGYQRVAVMPGPQHLDGIHALQYVRSRYSDFYGDLGRSARQQQVLLALRAKARYLGPADLPVLVGTLSGEMKTSMNIERLRELLPVATSIKTENIKQIVLVSPYTSYGHVGNQSVLIGNWGAILPLVHHYFP
jgi:LCP family protein required for cell wall assembly